ncbi:MAG: winged helix-turn-helix domain-containing protein [Methanocellales archaeon]|nr:winged helix-turn-helix domain-containing protein [Methanocellales archaeon]
MSIDKIELEIIDNSTRVEILKRLYETRERGRGVPQHVLRKSLKISRSTMVYNVNKLKKAGYVKGDYYMDGRRSFLRITDNGVDLLEKYGIATPPTPR